jgi:hypothetical protein
VRRLRQLCWQRTDFIPKGAVKHFSQNLAEVKLLSAIPFAPLKNIFYLII